MAAACFILAMICIMIAVIMDEPEGGYGNKQD